MRTLTVFALLLLATHVYAKSNLQPPKPIERSGPKATAPCRLPFADEVKAARALAAKSSFAVYPIEGADVARFLGVFNAAEPKTDFQADAILVAVANDFAYVELFVGGCIRHEGKLKPAAFDALMNQAFGDDLPNALAL